MVLNDVFELTANYAAWAPENEFRATIEKENWPKALDDSLDEKLRNSGFTREQFLAIPQAKELLERMREWDPTPFALGVMDALVPRLNDMMSSKLQTTMGVISFTEEPASLLMWAHYADKHTGFLIEYDPEHPWFSRPRGPDDWFFRLRQVRYTRDRPAPLATESSGEDLYLTKSADWEYEKEWRVVVPFQDCEVRGEDARHDVPVHAVMIPREAMKGVVLGCRTRPEIRRAVIEQAGGLPIFEAAPRKDTYALEISAVP